MSDNPCGTCTQCCKTMKVTEINKPAHAWCQHCAIGKGCKVYDTRPETCQGFECFWLYTQRTEVPPGVRMPLELRPDKTRVVMAITGDGERLIAHVDPSRPDAWKTGAMGRWIDQHSKKRPVFVVIGDKRKHRRQAEAGRAARRGR
jgi:hypothetical protein